MRDARGSLASPVYYCQTLTVLAIAEEIQMARVLRVFGFLIIPAIMRDAAAPQGNRT